MPSSARPPLIAIKRPLFALAIVVGILGAVWAYERFQESVKLPLVGPAEQLATQAYRLDVTLTFPAAADSFALNDAYSLLLTFRGKTLLKETDPIEPGQPLRLGEISGIVIGRNEFYLEVIPADAGDSQEHAVRLRAWQGEQVVAEQTLWSPPGEPVRGLLTLEVPPAPTSSDHE